MLSENMLMTLRDISVFFLLLLFASSAPANTDFVVGKDFEQVSPNVKTQTKAGEIEVVELFWYGCSHCFAFEPEIAIWKKQKPEFIKFRRVPAIFDRKWVSHARAYYTAEKLGISQVIHLKLFEALHTKKQTIYTENEFAKFFESVGVTKEAFTAAYTSFEVDTLTRKAMALTRSYGIGGVPSMVVSGKFRSSVSNAGSFERLLKVVDFLARRELKMNSTFSP
jgi:thiol:disulfide interchange protein DsbA